MIMKNAWKIMIVQETLKLGKIFVTSYRPWQREGAINDMKNNKSIYDGLLGEFHKLFSNVMKVIYFPCLLKKIDYGTTDQ